MPESSGIAMAADAPAPAPRLLANGAYQGPVRAEPGALLAVAGADLRGVSLATVRDRSGAVLGDAVVVSAGAAPDGLTLRLPGTIPARAPLTVALARTGASPAVVRLNDPRPLWFLPARVASSAALPGLPRSLRVVGRNLDALPGTVRRVRLSGPATVVLDAVAGDPLRAEFLLDVDLPARLPVGRYAVEVLRGGDTAAVVGSALEVLPDPAPRTAIDVGRGGCAADDGRDDTGCVVAAIDAAARAGGAAVRFGPGQWDLLRGDTPGVLPVDGLVVPEGVDLVGAGAGRTRIVVGDLWSPTEPRAVFALDGRNVVTGLAIEDRRALPAAGRIELPVLQLGRVFYRTDRRSVEDVSIVGNRIEASWIAIGDGGLPLRRLVVTGNDLAAHSVGLAPGGNRYHVASTFRVEDSVIRGNVFHPGRYVDVPGRQGPIAATIGASERVDFSDNVADGRSRRLLTPDGPSGWRAGFFWHLGGPQERLLVSSNEVTCPGDRIGDGEAFAFDNNGNTYAFPGARPVLAAGAAHVEVAGPATGRQADRDLPGPGYYVGHWVTVADGEGAGQARRIVRVGMAAKDGRLRFDVEPDWDIPPRPGATRIAVARQFWQVLVVANRVDQRTPGCTKANVTDVKGGGIVLWGQMADSAVVGNRQFDTDGILLHQASGGPSRECPGCGSFLSQLLAIEIRENRIDGEYAGERCSIGGIQSWFTSDEAGPPLLLASGVNIEANTVFAADGAAGSAIGFQRGARVTSGAPLLRGIVVQRNEIDAAPRVSTGRPVTAACAGGPARRIGIGLHAARVIRGAVLDANLCRNVDRAVQDEASGTVLACDGPPVCGCTPTRRPAGGAP